MEISFSDIKPYLRFVRYMHLTNTSAYAPYVPYDARLFYAMDGESIIEAGGRAYPMQKNSLLLINSGVDYHIKTPEHAVSYLAINFDFTFASFQRSIPIHPAPIDHFDRGKLVSHVEFSDARVFNEVCYIEQFASIEQTLIAMEKEFSQKINWHELKLSADMTGVLVRCYRHLATGGFAPDERKTAKEIISYVQSNFHRPLTNDEIAAHFHYHPNYVSALIKQFTGYPLHRYIKNIRIAKAADLLASTELGVCDVALSCGFYDTSHFIRCFKDAMAMTPQQYRNRYQ